MTSRHGLAVVLLAAAMLAPGLAAAQVNNEPTELPTVRKNPYGSGVGMNIALTNSGFGLGAYLMRVNFDNRISDRGHDDHNTEG